MTLTSTVTIAAVAWIALILFTRWLGTVPIRDGADFDASILYRIIQLYARFVHRLRAEGLENVPQPRNDHPPGPLIIAANHTAGIDPLLIQSVLRFEPRWMMAEDMRARKLESLWQIADIIFVDRTGGDMRSLRESLRHLKRRAVLGVFPEGSIERPPRHLLPFQAGVALLIQKAHAPVLPVVVDDTPQGDTAWSSLFRRSRSRIRFLPIVHYEQTDLSHEQIADDLRKRFVDATGWPNAPRTPIFTPTRTISLDLDGNYIDEQGNPVSDDEAQAIADQAETAS